MGDESEGTWEQPDAAWATGEVGALPGIQGIPAEELLTPPDPAAAALTETIPPAPPPAEPSSWLEGVARTAWTELTTPPDQRDLPEPNPYTEEEDRRRSLEQQMDDEVTGTHTISTPEIHF